jgi:hypothetical protein
MLLSILFVAATTQASWKAGIDAYREALDAAKRGASMERLFGLTERLKEVFQPIGGDTRTFDELSESDLAALQAQLPGMILNNQEVILVQPDARFFQVLAQKHGRPVDIAFFDEYLLTYPDSVWASYLSQVTDVTACTDFGSGELVKRYGGWLRYRRSHSAYRKYADLEIARIEEEVGNTCACGDRESVVRELSDFVRRFPNSPAAPAAKKQLRDLGRAKSQFRFHCKPN